MRFKSDRLKPVQPELVASKDASRPVLTTVHLNADKSRVEVTDSYMLATFPVELDEGDTSGPVPIEALKASRKAPLKHVAERAGTSIRCNSHVEVRHAFGADASEPYLTMPRESGDYKFPDIDNLIPENVAPFSIGIDPTKLLALAKAMGSPDRVELRFTQGPDRDPSPLRPFLVRPIGGHEDDPSGLIMPVRLP